jgi:hydroxyacylglutathione hydrolase
MKKALLVIGAILVLLVGTGLAVFGPMVIGVEPAIDGTKLADGTVTLVADGYVFINVLDGDPGQVALIDCGNDPKGEKILGALKARNLGPEAVKAIFLTHGHPDHVAGCHLFPAAELYAFAGDVKIAAGEERAKGPLPRMVDLPKEKAAKVTKTLTEGQVVEIGSLQVKAYALPGHTAGSAAYLSKGLLYLGDSAMGRAGGKGVKPAPWVVSDDTAQNVAELKKLHERLKAENAPVKTLVFSHTGPHEGLDGLLTAVQ